MKLSTLISWIIVLSCSLGYNSYTLITQSAIETNILKLLPPENYNAGYDQAVKSLSEEFSQQVFYLIPGKDFNEAQTLAADFYSQMNQSELFAEIQYRDTTEFQTEFYKLYFPYRYQLNFFEKPQDLIQQAQYKLYGPSSSLFQKILSTDPLLLFPHWAQSLQSLQNNYQVQDGYLFLKDTNQHYIFIQAKLQQHSFNPQTQDQLSHLNSNFPQILSTGVVYFAQSGRQSAQSDISTIGVGSTLGIILLFIIAFRSLKHLLVGLLPLFFGFNLALSVSLLIFHEIHMITIVFGMSMIGVCIDYAFHYFTDSITHRHPLRKILPGITMGMLTSLIAYAGMSFSGFPGLFQISIFSAVGLIASYLTVVFIYPILAPSQTPQTLLYHSVSHYWSIWTRFIHKYKVIFLGTLLIMSSFGFYQITFDDNIQQLQSKDPNLVEMDQKIHQLLSTPQSQSFYLVRGSSVQEVLEREESLRQQLDSNYLAISSFVPSTSKQLNNWHQLKSFEVEQLNENYFQALGFEDEALHSWSQAVGQVPIPLSLEQYFDSPLSKLTQKLWLGEIESSFYSIVLLTGKTQVKSLPEGIIHVNRVKDLSQVFKTYRLKTIHLLWISYLIIFIVLALRYRLRQALLIIIAPISSVGITLFILSLLGISLNFFSILAFILILGIGIDYTLFLKESPTQTSQFAVFLSCITTFLSFGLLALSSTAALSLFGICICLGIITALLVAPIVQVSKT